MINNYKTSSKYAYYYRLDPGHHCDQNKKNYNNAFTSCVEKKPLSIILICHESVFTKRRTVKDDFTEDVLNSYYSLNRRGGRAIPHCAIYIL